MPNSRFSRTLAVLSGIVLLAANGVAEELSVIADSFTRTGVPTRNYGGNGVLHISSWNTRTAYLRSPLPGDTGTVESALLSFTVKDVHNAGYVDVHLVQGGWSESGITANNAPVIDPVPIASIRVEAGNVDQTLSVDVSDAFTAWLAAPNTNFGLALVPSSRESVSVSIYSRETSSAPTLSVTISGGGGSLPPPNAPPIAFDDDYTVSEGSGPTQLDVLANDTDADLPGDSIIISAVGSTSDGGIATNNGSSITYTPAAGFSGIETFNYTITDQAGALSAATVEVTVEAAPAPAPTGNVTAAVTEDAFTRSGVPTRNYGGNSVLHISTWNSRTSYLRFDVSALAGGTVSTATLRVVAKSVSNSGWADVHVIQSPWSEGGITHNSAPIIDPSPIAALRFESSSVDQTLTADVTGVVQGWAASPGTHYGLALVPSSREPISVSAYSSETSRPPSLLVAMSGGGGGGTTNSPPNARNDNFLVDNTDSNVFLNVLSNDSDPDLPSDSLSIVSTGTPSNGGIVVNNGTSLRYTPSSSFTGTETFSYTIADEAGQTDSAVVSISVSGSGTIVTRTWRVMPIGDSITEASGSRNSYRRPLWHSLNDAGYEINFVGSRNGNRDGQVPNPDFDTQHEGHWGWKADRFLNNNNILNWAQTHQPDVALIHLGTNDIFNGQSVSSTIAEIGQIIDVLRSVNPNIRILVAQIIPTSDPGRPSLDPFNAAIPALVSSKNTARSPVRVVDQNSGFNASVDTYDGVHPDLSGEIKMANKWYDALVPLLTN